MTLTVPTRHDNPFATCWTRPGALRFVFADGDSLATVTDRLELHGWRGQIVGAHGSGKSTLLAELAVEMRRRGRAVYGTSLRGSRRWLPDDVFAAARRGPPAVIVIDGHERVAWPHRWRLACCCRSYATGLLVTAHRPLRLPMLARTAPDLAIVQRLVDQLTGGACAAFTQGYVAASFARHNGNVREIFFDLYDRCERHAAR